MIIPSIHEIIHEMRVVSFMLFLSLGFLSYGIFILVSMVPDNNSSILYIISYSVAAVQCILYTMSSFTVPCMFCVNTNNYWPITISILVNLYWFVIYIGEFSGPWAFYSFVQSCITGAIVFVFLVYCSCRYFNRTKNSIYPTALLDFDPDADQNC